MRCSRHCELVCKFFLMVFAFCCCYTFAIASDELLNRQLCDAVKKGDLVLTKSLLARGADIHGKESNSDNTYLDLAAFRGNLDLVQFFIEKGLDVKGKDMDDERLLGNAAIGGNPAIVKLFVDRGVNINVRPKKKTDNTPFMLACFMGNLEVVKAFVEKGADISFRDSRGRTTLSVVTNFAKSQYKQPGHNEIIAYLRSLGAK